MKILLALVVAAMLIAVALVATAPATLLAEPIASGSLGRLALADASGTVWHGRGDIAFTQGGFLLPIEWRVSPMGLLSGELRGTAVVDRASGPPASFVLSRNEILLENVALKVPARAIALVAGLPPMYGEVRGMADVRVDRLARSAARLAAKAAVDWRDAGVSGPVRGFALALGNVHAEVSGDGAIVPGSFRNEGGDIGVDGTFVLPVAGTPSVDTTVSPRPGLAPDRLQLLNAGLSAMVKPQPDGAYRLHFGPAR